MISNIQRFLRERRYRKYQNRKMMRVDFDSPQFKLKVEKMDWKEVIVVAMILATIITIVFLTTN